jgi:hypothetical protein
MKIDMSTLQLYNFKIKSNMIKMRKFPASFSLLVVLFCLVSVFSCDNEPVDDGIDLGTNNNNQDLVGVWNLLEFDVTLNSATTFEGQTITSNIDIVSTDVAYTLDFEQNSFTTNGNYTYNVNLVVDGNINTSESYTLNNVSGSGTYTTTDNEMTLEGSFFEFDFEGADNMAFQEEQTIDFQLSNDGETLTFTQNDTVSQTDDATGVEITSTTSSISVWVRGEVSNICSAQSATNNAESAFNEDDTDENLCNAYKTALQNQITECGDTDGSLQDIIDDLGDCSFYTMGESGSLVVTVGTLLVDFINQNISLQDGIIYVDATNSAGNYTVYFEVIEGATGVNSLQNFVISFNGTDYFPSTQGVDDFESETTVSSQGIFIATFNGIVESTAGADLSLTQGMADLNY